jgi:hypothetical protein
MFSYGSERLRHRSVDSITKIGLEANADRNVSYEDAYLLEFCDV